MTHWTEQDDDGDDWRDDDDSGVDDVLSEADEAKFNGDLVPCPFCRRMVYADADVCPGCRNFLLDGDDPAAPQGRPRWMTIGTILVLLAMLIAAATRMW